MLSLQSALRPCTHVTSLANIFLNNTSMLRRIFVD